MPADASTPVKAALVKLAPLIGIEDLGPAESG